MTGIRGCNVCNRGFERQKGGEATSRKQPCWLIPAPLPVYSHCTLESHSIVWVWLGIAEEGGKLCSSLGYLIVQVMPDCRL